MSTAATRTQGFPPVIDSGIHTLILGSFPSVVSLAKAQYYGHPQNQFWRLTGAVLGVPLHEIDYEKRLQILLKHRIGLWDVIWQCSRVGSLDYNIRAARRNDFRQITRVAAQLRHVCFNGKAAGKMEIMFAHWGFETGVLPSSSAANTMPFKEKLKQWRWISRRIAGVNSGNAASLELSRPC